MKLVCPSCGCYGSPEAFLAEADAGAEDLAALAMPSQIAAELQQYLRLFRPGQRAMLAKRRRRLLAELLPVIQAGQLTFDGRLWPAPLDYWREAIRQMVDGRDKLTLPLANHNYLYRVVAGLANKAEARGEAGSHQARAGTTPIGVSAAHRPFAPEPAQQPTPAAPAGFAVMPAPIKGQLKEFVNALQKGAK